MGSGGESRWTTDTSLTAATEVPLLEKLFLGVAALGVLTTIAALARGETALALSQILAIVLFGYLPVRRLVRGRRRSATPEG